MVSKRKRDPRNLVFSQLEGTGIYIYSWWTGNSPECICEHVTRVGDGFVLETRMRVAEWMSVCGQTMGVCVCVCVFPTKSVCDRRA